MINKPYCRFTPRWLHNSSLGKAVHMWARRVGSTWSVWGFVGKGEIGQMRETERAGRRGSSLNIRAMTVIKRRISAVIVRGNNYVCCSLIGRVSVQAIPSALFHLPAPPRRENTAGIWKALTPSLTLQTHRSPVSTDNCCSSAIIDHSLTIYSSTRLRQNLEHRLCGSQIVFDK